MADSSTTGPEGRVSDYSVLERGGKRDAALAGGQAFEDVQAAYQRGD